MGMRERFEEILDLKHSWDRLGRGFRENFGDEKQQRVVPKASRDWSH